MLSQDPVKYGMLYQKTQKQTTDLGGFLNGREQERYSMPLALQFLYSSCPICQLFSCPDRQMFEIVEIGSGSANHEGWKYWLDHVSGY